MQSLFSQSGLSYSLFQQVHQEMLSLSISEAELDKIRDTLNKTLWIALIYWKD